MGKLKSYSVIVTRDITESCTIIVNATSPAEAEGLARQASHGEDITWTVDDPPNGHDHYTNGAEEA